MYCQNCGALVEEHARLCLVCGKPPLRSQAPGTVDIADDPAMRLLLPVGRSLWAIAAGYAGLFAVTILLAPVALVLGIVAIMDIKRHPEKHGMGRAIFGVAMGALGSILLLVALVGILLSGAAR
jgi:hypothetical protein